MTGVGGRDVGAFRSTVTLSAPPVFSNKSALAIVDSAQPLNVRWNGGSGSAYVLIGGYVSDLNEAFVCTEDASKGTFTVPPFVIAALRRRGESNATLFIGGHPLSHPVSIPGLDAAYFLDGDFDSVAVAFQP